MAKRRKNGDSGAEVLDLIRRFGLTHMAELARDFARKDSYIRVRCSSGRLRIYGDAAAAARLTFAEWVIATLDQAAALELAPPTTSRTP